MRFDVVTLFPEFFESPLSSGLLGKAIVNQIAEVQFTNPRDFAPGKHRKVDDVPYGGGAGMVMKVEPLFAAIESLPVYPKREVIYFTPQGVPMDQAMFKTLLTYDQLILLCGNYEGVDERVMTLVTREISLGDFVLTGGEIPALALINGTVRLMPGTIGKEESHQCDSFEDGLLDFPHYTRPPIFRDLEVPEVLRSGNHGAIAAWRKQQQQERTSDRRPDLYEQWLNEPKRD